MAIKDFFKPRESNFLRLLKDQAQKTLEGMEALEEFMRTGDEKEAKRVGQCEREEDELRRILIDDLNRTFVTPIDREDIFALSRAIDDILDYAYSTVDEMSVFGVGPNPFLQRMVSVLREAADEIQMAVGVLKDRPNLASQHAARAKVLENQAEAIYREATAELFRGSKSVDDIVYLLKMREIYRHLSNAADRGDETANIIGDIVVKMT
jgi:predicted phosphate transport protein (TIGR00153 family)